MTTAEQRHESGTCIPQTCKFCWWDDLEPTEDQGERNEDWLEQQAWDMSREEL